jgi:phosphoglycolate phosphatase
MNYTHVIWDWNGTLLDDVAWCMTTVNTMLAKRGLPVLGGLAAYHRVFGFPIIDYYRRAGFDFEQEPFETLAAEYIDFYHGGGSDAALFPGARALLADIQRAGLRQVILSASELSNLFLQLRPFGVDAYFDEILGIPDIYAASKMEIGKVYIAREKPGKAVLIGDTAHDREVAHALGVDCVLVANGHQSKNTLLSCDALVVDCLADVRAILGL